MTQKWHIDIITITITVFKLAKENRLKEPPRRGPKGYTIAERIAVLTYVILRHTSYSRALKELEKTIVPGKIGLRSIPSQASISRWKKSLELYVRLLIRLSFLRLCRGRMHKLLAVIDGTGFKLGKASIHYLKRTGKRAPYMLVTVIHAPEVDGIFDVVAAPNCNDEIRAFANYLFFVLISAGIFWGLVGDKKYDASWVTIWCEAYSITTFIPARGGKLEPSDGPRLEANLRYEWLMAQKHFRALVESAFASMKSFFNSIESRGDKAAEIDVLVLAMTYNVARCVARGFLGV